jgi:hypothetical protein
VFCGDGLRKLSRADGAEIWAKPELTHADDVSIGADNVIFVSTSAPARLTAYSAAGDELWHALSTPGIGGYGALVRSVGTERVLWNVSDTPSEVDRHYLFSQTGEPLRGPLTSPSDLQFATATDTALAIGYTVHTGETIWSSVEDNETISEEELDGCVKKEVFQSSETP